MQKSAFIIILAVMMLVLVGFVSAQRGGPPQINLPANAADRLQAFCASICTPSDEVCDSIDNDCDGLIDEDFPTLGTLCLVGVGQCQAAGIQICTADGATTECSASSGSPSSEACDSIDNDCDGFIDEDFVDLGTSCLVGTGICQNAGIEVCDGTGTGTECSATSGVSSTETCNGLDDDCDGLIDEDFSDLGDVCVVGIGACQNVGFKVCDGSGAGTECSASSGTPDTETCNGLDDDCDGATDEGLTAPSCALQQGVCSGSTKTCGGASGFLDCDTSNFGPNYEAVETTCDGLDNDCDGIVDESLTTTFFQDLDSDSFGDPTVTQDACIQPGGFVLDNTDCDDAEASVNPGATEVCDGLDNDCDGNIDEGGVCP